MLQRREFVVGLGAVAAQFVPGLAKAGTVVAVDPTDIVAAPVPSPSPSLVPPPQNGLGANHNYFLHSAGNPIRDLSVEILLTEDLAAQGGFSFQLNCWSPTNSRSTWQQYGFVFHTEDKSKPQISWWMENWPSPDYLDQLHQTIGVPKPSDLFDRFGPLVVLPGPGFTIRAGYKFKTTLLYDANDPSGAVTGAAFSILDGSGKSIIDDHALIKSFTFAKTSVLIDSAALAPIVAAQLNICARAGGVYGFMRSGAGTITYAATTPLTALSAHPVGLAAPSTITEESSNAIYGQLPAPPALKCTQTFSTIKAPAFQVGGSFAVSHRSNANRADVFAVSVSGQLSAFIADANGHWKRSADTGPINMAEPIGAVAATTRASDDKQSGVFLVDQQGQLQAFWVSATGVSGPIAASAKDFARRGAGLAASPRFGARGQTDAYLFDMTGQLNVFSSSRTDALSGPVKVGPVGFAPDGGHLAAAQRTGVAETDVFAIDVSGALSWFRVDSSGAWSGPQKISAANFARPGGHVVAGPLSGKPGQTDVLVLDQHGQPNLFSIGKTGAWSGPVPLGPTGFADPSASIALVRRASPGQSNVIAVDKQGSLTVVSADGSGDWGSPKQIGQPGAAPGGAHVVAAPQTGLPARSDVFVINDVAANASGWPEVTSVDQTDTWTAAARLTP